MFGALSKTVLKQRQALTQSRSVGLSQTSMRGFASYVMSIDQGTTSSRVLLIDENLKIVDSASREHE